MLTFFQIGLHGTVSVAIPHRTMEAVFEKMFLYLRKRPGADFWFWFVWWVVWAESLIQI
jgi:hypothetical protein